MTEFDFTRSSYSASGGECVEVARNILGVIALRDFKAPDVPLVLVAPESWVPFIHFLAGGRA